MKSVAVFLILFSSWCAGCALFETIAGTVDEAAFHEADTNDDGEVSEEELEAFIQKVKNRTSDNLPFPFNIIGGLVVGAAGSAWSEWRKRKAMRALNVMYDAVETTGKDSPVKKFVAGMADPMIEKLHKKRKKLKQGRAAVAR